MRIIVVGAGEVGSSIAASLCGTHEVVVVDIDPDRVSDLTYELDVLAIEGDGGDRTTLQEAGIGDADLVIASTDDDETNIVTCGTADTLGDAFTICRVKGTQYLDTWRNADGAFGIDFMVCTVLLTAESVVRLIGLPAAQDVDTFSGGAVRMAQFEVPVDSPVADQTVAEADRWDSLTFAAIVRDEEFVIPSGDTYIRADDEVIVIGSPECVREFAADLSPRSAGPDDIVIVGGSEVGFQTARLLEERGFRPRLIEREGERARQLAEDLPKTTVMESDATDRDFLEREHVGDADVVVTALDNDEKNLLAALLAKRLGAQRTVSLTETGAYVQLFEAVGVDVAVNPRETVAEEITRFTREQRAENVAIIEDDRAEVLELTVDEGSSLADRAIRESVPDLPAGTVIGAITRDGSLVTPRGETVIRPGDHVVLFVNTEDIDAVAAQV
ncbi:Trk system potassium transporter TrkA [Halomarina oriensis]|uniref:Trk system potassium transporter TrkA n=1 Tax=Halomarina oriensis TaxID=671145 RepID=A0A6B0GNR6_9EURY|nr:Trk system potassium transporter TrkA [Halomarina oriensis]